MDTAGLETLQEAKRQLTYWKRRHNGLRKRYDQLKNMELTVDQELAGYELKVIERELGEMQFVLAKLEEFVDSVE